MHLKNRGITVNDCVGVIARHTTNIGPAIIGAQMIGSAVNPLDVSFTSDDISHMFNMTKPRIIFCDSDVVNTLQIALKNIKSDAIIVTMEERVGGCDFIDEYLVHQDGEDIFVYVTY